MTAIDVEFIYICLLNLTLRGDGNIIVRVSHWRSGVDCINVPPP